MKKIIFISIVFLCFQSCQHRSESKPSQSLKQAEKRPEIVEVQNLEDEVKLNVTINRDSINNFLNKPFDLINFKEATKGANSTSGEQEEYYMKPNKEGMYYKYFLFSKLQGYIGTNKNRIILKEDGLEIIVYKELGKYQYEFNDPTEELIEIKAKFNNFDLPELAFVGLDSVSITKKLGKPDFYKKGCMVYQHNNNVLILKLAYKRVKWLKYTRMKKGLDFHKAENILKD